MLKPVFFLLLAANAALFAVGQGYVGHLADGEREPARLDGQLNAKALKLIPAAQATAVAAEVAPGAEVAAQVAPPVPAPKAAAVTLACLEAGDFTLAQARRFEAALDPLALGDRQSRRNLPGQDVSSYMVNIPPQGSKEAADKKVAELKARGVTNYFVMNDSQPLRWGISLGVFKQEAAAQTQLAALVKQGVHSARITPRYSPSKLLAFQFRDVGPDTRGRLDKLLANFADQSLRKCP
ncbi:sporulation related protein [Pseudoduganella lurida]|uniref:Sporulation related protein n=1 Tax=Pseudoduganella lurida TaxID=1036180 RepID=A0A562R3S5_9BURK|nr:SPOR domain-containing protein [Pseudoduganella lurida]TWI63701.1 sporulation related protein [Pseudoduganella lurida]